MCEGDVASESLSQRADDGLQFKLLIQDSASESLYDDSVEAGGVNFLDAFHHRQLSSGAIAELQKMPVAGRTLLLAYDEALGRVVPANPHATI